MEGQLDLELLAGKIASEKGLLLYFSNETCSVCKVLKPKVIQLLEEQFPRISFLYVDTDKNPMISGQYRVFTIPTILICFEGREQFRFSRNFSLYELEDAILKIYPHLG